jgi:O-methyltransferase
MSKSFRTTVKAAIAKTLPDSTRWDVLGSLPKLDTWRRKYVGKDCPIFDSREQLYDHLLNHVLKGQSIDFLEFGVYKGESISYWSQADRHPNSRFYGFDTFTGLPEDWQKFSGDMAKEVFDCGGVPPALADPRVAFVKGLFQDSLDPFLADFTLRSQLVLHNDSDLYSSTLYVLTRCHDFLKPGAIVIFDEFSSVLNEFMALKNYCSAYRRDYEVLGATAQFYAQVAIRFM